jgi:hypothetical protein
MTGKLHRKKSEDEQHQNASHNFQDPGFHLVEDLIALVEVCKGLIVFVEGLGKSPTLKASSVVLVAPESYPFENKPPGQEQPRDDNDYDAQLANSLDVAIKARVGTKESAPVAPNIGSGEQINDEKQSAGNSQCRKSGGINVCNHNSFQCGCRIHKRETG